MTMPAGMNPHNEDALEESTERAGSTSDPAVVYGDDPEAGPLLTGSPKEVWKQVKRMWKARGEDYGRWEVEWEVNQRTRDGEHNVWAVKRQDQNAWQVYLPPGQGRLPPAVLNKADRLCQRLISYLYADPPAPEVVPGTGEDSDRDAAEFAYRVLVDLQSESGLNDLDAHRAAFDLANSTRSAFIHYWTDPHSGGRQPITVLASPQAQRVEEALSDPATGQPWPGDLITRYVREDGTLVDGPEQAALQWVPALVRDVLPPTAVRFWPSTAKDLWDADGVLVADVLPYREWARRYDLAVRPEVATKAKDIRPAEFKKLWPKREPKDDDPLDALVLGVQVYLRECPDYPDGCHVVLVGDQIGVQEPWMSERDGTRQPLDLPLVQCKQFRGPLTDPHGRGLMDFLGNANQLRAHLVGVIEDVLDRNANRKVFIPTNSLLQSKQQMLPFMSYIPINPGGEPKYEDLIPVPGEALTLLETVNREMDDASGLQETGQGLNTSNVNSGRQALTIVSQVQAGLSDLKQNAERAYVRACRVQLQLVGKDYTIPRMLSWEGADGAYKVQRWMGSDLKSTKDVRIRPGTMSMMPPLQKLQAAVQWGQLVQAGLAQPDDLQDFVASSLKGLTGLEDNPHLQRVRRQVELWRQGPPEGFVEQAQQAQQQHQQVQQQAQQAQQQHQQGQQQVQQQYLALTAQAQAQALPPPLPPPPASPPPPPPPFQPPPPPDPLRTIPADSQPQVAQLRVRELGRAMASVTFLAQPAEWRSVLVTMYGEAQQALAPPPAPAPGGPPPAPGAPPPPPQGAGQPPQLMGPEADVLGTGAAEGGLT